MLLLPKPIDNESTIALSVIRFGVDDILNTTNLIVDGTIDYNRISLFFRSRLGSKCSLC